MRFLIVMVLILGTISGAAQRARPSGPTIANGIVAVVNNKVITREDVLNSSAQVEEMLYRQYGLQPSVHAQKVEEARKDALKMLIENQLILHDFETSEFKLPEAYIEDTIKRDIRENFRDGRRLTETLRSQGITTETYRQRVRERIIINLMTGKNVASEILISPQKIKDYYESRRDDPNVSDFKLPDRVKLSMLTIEKAKHGTEGARNLAREILILLEKGANFGEVASVYSDDPQRREGGSRGWVDAKSLRTDLSNVAFSLKAGQHSGVIDAAEACYIMMAEEVSPAHIEPLNEVRDRIETSLRTAERQRLRDRWINRLRSKQFVQEFPGA